MISLSIQKFENQEINGHEFLLHFIFFFVTTTNTILLISRVYCMAQCPEETHSFELVY